MATMNAVAKLAKVSVSTVSYVLTGTRPISQRTRDTVMAAVLELDYQPNAMARGLASRRSTLLGLLPLIEVQLAGERVTVLRELGVPLTLIGRIEDTTGIPYVDIDFDQTAAIAALAQAPDLTAVQGLPDRSIDGGTVHQQLLPASWRSAAPPVRRNPVRGAEPAWPLVAATATETARPARSTTSTA